MHPINKILYYFGAKVIGVKRAPYPVHNAFAVMRCPWGLSIHLDLYGRF